MVASPRSAAVASDAGEGGENPQTGSDRAADRARDLGPPRAAAVVRNRKFENAQSGARRPHLHLEVPSVSHLTHTEAPQREGADRSEGAHVREVNTIDEPDRSADSPPGKNLMGSHAAPLTRSASARPDHKIVCAVEDRLHQAR